MANVVGSRYLKPAVSWTSALGVCVLKIEDQDCPDLWVEVNITTRELWMMYSLSVPEPVPVAVADLPDLVDDQVLVELPPPATAGELPELPPPPADEFPW